MLLAGTYERFLFGFNLKLSEDKHKDTQDSSLTRTCTFAAHQNAVKCVGTGGFLVATGGADDQIHLYDIKHGQDLGFLMNPGDGAVPCIQFYCPKDARGAPSHMFSGSADGSIAVWHAGGQWEHLKLMKGHKASVNSIALHPSGRLAMSVAHDCSLRLWDLTRGVSKFSTKLPVEADTVVFTSAGDEYLLASGGKVTVHSVVGDGTTVATLEHPRRVCSLALWSESTLLTGLEDGTIKIWDSRTSSVQLNQARAHATRIRGLVPVPSGFGHAPEHLASASSDGVIKLWDLRALSSSSDGSAMRCLKETATHARITCLAFADPQAPKARALQAPVAQPDAVARQPGKSTQTKKQHVANGRTTAVTQTRPTGKRVGSVNPGFEIVSEEQQAKKQKQREMSMQQGEDADGNDEAKVYHVPGPRATSLPRKKRARPGAAGQRLGVDAGTQHRKAKNKLRVAGKTSNRTQHAMD